MRARTQVSDGEGGPLALLGDGVVPVGLDDHIGLREVPQPQDLGLGVGSRHAAGECHVAPLKASPHGLRVNRRAPWGSEEGRERCP